MSPRRLLIVDDNQILAAELGADGERLGLDVRMVHDTSTFESVLKTWNPNITMDLVMPDSDGLELIHICGRSNYRGALILMSGGFELHLKMAEEIARTNNNLNVVAKMPKPFRPRQFSYVLMSLL
jgi:CheY-like chemotaxis protein